jgi:hypothetical protein
MGAYKGKALVFKEADEKTNGFKKGGVAKKNVGDVDGVMSEAHAGRKPRKSGGSVMSSAASGTPRGKASHY